MGEDGSTIAKKWRAIQGSNNWEGMLHPVDEGLRESFLLYGDLIQATYDAFISDSHTKYLGSSRFGKKDFFCKVTLAEEKGEPWLYEATRFLYATSSVDLPDSLFVKPVSDQAWSKESNWIGYVAVATEKGKAYLGRRDIVVAWRGTIRMLEWADVLLFQQKSIESITNHSNHARPEQSSERPTAGDKAGCHCLPIRCLGRDHNELKAEEEKEEAKVMSGWLTIYTSSNPDSRFSKKSARDQLWAEIRRLLELYKDEEISITLVGHSLGAALAVLSGFDIVYNGLSSSTRAGKEEEEPIPVTAFVVGCPEVGNKAFKQLFESLQALHVLHLVNVLDVIPHYPGNLLHYREIGTRLEVDTRKSSYLKDSRNPSDWHNLQANLHVLAGWQGKDKPWKLLINRSVALVNKSCDFLKDECLVPDSWWVHKNKGLVKNKDGLWVYPEPIEEDVPHPEH